MIDWTFGIVLFLPEVDPLSADQLRTKYVVRPPLADQPRLCDTERVAPQKTGAVAMNLPVIKQINKIIYI